MEYCARHKNAKFYNVDCTFVQIHNYIVAQTRPCLLRTLSGQTIRNNSAHEIAKNM